MAVTLFPPILAVNLPASDINKTGEEKNFHIKFSFSQFNSKNDIAGIQCTIRKMEDNSNALTARYEIIQFESSAIYQDTLDNNFFYITVDKNVINNLSSAYYKVQLRFISKDAKVEAADQDIFPSWIADNPGLFSEWSTVGLLRFVNPPTVTMDDLKDYKSRLLTVSSGIEYAEGETDYIEKFKYSLYLQTDLNNPIETSGWLLSSSDTKVLTYEFKKELSDKTPYRVKLEYQTHEDYRPVTGVIPNEPQDFTTKLSENKPPIDGVSMSYTPDPDRGIISVKISNIDPEKAKDYLDNNKLLNIIIKRADSTTQFSQWETIQDCKITLNQSGNFSWDDNTVEGGVWHKYGYYVKYYENNSAIVTNLYVPEINPQMCYIEDMFLTNVKGTLRVRLNQQIDTLKYIVNEQITTTLGNKYPVIFRSGNTRYRQFNISGTIATGGDRVETIPEKHNLCTTTGTPTFDSNSLKGESLFLSEEDLSNSYGNIEVEGKEVPIYEADYKETYNITSQNNFIFEKALRDKVIDFLYDNSAKLFKTLTEGNILVKLTNISFTPNKTTGRMIYDFSATATEIAETTIENYDKYNIINIDNTTGHFEYEVIISDKPITVEETNPTTTINNYTKDSILTDEIDPTDSATEPNLKLNCSWVED